MDGHLYRGIVSGDIAVLEQFESSLLSQATHIKDTTLHVAVLYGKQELVAEVLRRCPSLLLKVNTYGDSALHVAAREGRSEMFKLFIDGVERLGDEDVESGGKEGVFKQLVRLANNKKDTALHEAVRNGNHEVVKLLTEADPEFQYFPNNFGETPLYLAAGNGLADTVRQILDKCPSSAHAGPNGMTAMHAAVMAENSGIIKMLLSKQPTLNREVDDQGCTPLHYAAYILASEEICDQLLECDSSVAYIRDEKGMSPLHVAASGYGSRLIELLIQHCPDCWQVLEEKGHNLLHIAALGGKERMIKYVLSTDIITKTCINQPDVDGNTPLHLACSSRRYGVVKRLAEDGRVNVNAMNKENKTAFEILEEADHYEDGHVDVYWKAAREALRMRTANATTYRYSFIDVNINGNYTLESKDEKEKRSKARKERFRERQKMMLEKMEKVSDSHLVVAALIATVTFTAGFAVPGGFKNDGPEEGMATLLRERAFQAFAISNTIAMLLSSLAVLIHFFMRVIGNRHTSNTYLLRAFYCTMGAILTMMLAFVTGTYAVLAHLPALAITTCVIASSFYLFCFLPFRHKDEFIWEW